MTALLLALLVAGASVRGGEAAELTPLRGAVHVHTTFSTGDLSLADIVAEARRERLDAVLLTDNLLLRFEYGLFPFRSVLKKVVEKPSVRRAGLQRYLEAVAAAQAAAPDVVLVPGVEVVPYYYWTGSLLGGDLTLWDAQKNLLVLGLPRPDDYARIPAIGGGPGAAAGATGLLTAAVGLGVMGGGVALLRARRARTVRLAHFTLRVEKRYRLPGAVAVGLGGLVVLEALATPELHPYRGDLGIAPYQRVIDYAESRGGAVLWSYPEARDFGRFEAGRLGTVTVRTQPYPEALLQSVRYTGFGGVYEDTVTFTDPGREWDQLLGEYARGARARPAWAIGEVGYHGRDKRLGGALTVFLAAERSPAAILAALRAGRVYAVRPLAGYHLVLEEFALGQEGGTTWAPMGAELEARGAASLLVRLRLAASDGREMPFALRLVRDGRVLATREVRTPFAETLRVDPPAPGTRAVFRVEVTAPHRLLSNPIFAGRPA